MASISSQKIIPSMGHYPILKYHLYPSMMIPRMGHFGIPSIHLQISSDLLLSKARWKDGGRLEGRCARRDGPVSLGVAGRT